MKVLVVVAHLVPEHMVVWEAAAKLGLDVHLAGTLDAPSLEAFDVQPRLQSDCPVHLFRPIGLLQRGQLWWRYPGLGRLVRSESFDLVHVNTEPWGLLVGQVLSSGSPVVVHACDNLYTHGHPIEAGIRTRVAQRNLRRLAGFVSWNAEGISLARRYGLAASAPTAVAPAIIPPPSSRPADHVEARRMIGVDPEEVIIGFVGRLESRKGVDWLLRAVDLGLPKRGHVVIVGDGPCRADLEFQARGMTTPVTFLGRRRLDETARLMSAFDILAVPSRTVPDNVEQFGRVVVEAMWAGAALVVSDCGALPAVAGDAAEIIAQDDVEGLHAALSRLVADPALRRTLADQGRKRAETIFHPSAVADVIKTVWLNAVS